MNFFLRLSGILKIYQEDLLCMDFIRLGQFLTKLPDDIPVSFLFQAIASINFPKQKFTQILAQQIEIAAQIKSVSSPAKWDLCTTLVSSVSSFPQSNRIFRRLRAASLFLHSIVWRAGERRARKNVLSLAPFSVRLTLPRSLHDQWREKGDCSQSTHSVYGVNPPLACGMVKWRPYKLCLIKHRRRQRLEVLSHSTA